MSFHERLQRHENVLSALELTIEDTDGVELYRTGVEHTFPNLHERLVEDDFEDITSQYIRYQPDGVLVDYDDLTVTHFDVKVGNNIEKDAYLTYEMLASVGLPVLIILNHNNERHRIVFDDLVLEDGNVTVSRYDEPYPVDDDGWIHPRKTSRDHYHRMKRRASMSGTPYRRILIDESISDQARVGRWLP